MSKQRQGDDDDLRRASRLRTPGPHLAASFVGRDVELDWLADRVLRRRQARPIVVTGIGGIGKTTLLQMLFAQVAEREPPAWLSLNMSPDPMSEASAFVEALYEDRSGPFHVVIDDADRLSDAQLEALSHRVFNLKRLRSLVFVTRRAAALSRAEFLRVGPFDTATAIELMLKRHISLPESELARAAEMAGGVPLAIKILTDLTLRHPELSFRDLLRGRIYDLESRFQEPPTKLIKELKPTIVIANESLLQELKRQPDSIYDLPPRKFEELIADLLDGMGFEVELTKATRDGGKDILAYMKTPIGKMLCLVEAKRYRRDRTVGVELVRTLFGTLVDHQANSAMLVTTSSFSKDAHLFQQRHEFQLSLNDYGNVVSWIQDHEPR